MMKVFNSLKRTVNIWDIDSVTLSEDSLAHWKEIAAVWKEANHWIEW